MACSVVGMVAGLVWHDKVEDEYPKFANYGLFCLSGLGVLVDATIAIALLTIGLLAVFHTIPLPMTIAGGFVGAAAAYVAASLLVSLFVGFINYSASSNDSSSAVL